MGGRFVFIGMLSFLGILFFGIFVKAYACMKRVGSDGKSMMEEAVNEETNTERMGLVEFLGYAVAILTALYFAIRLINKGGSGFSNLGRMIVLPSVMALFNARRRTGKSLFVILVCATFAFYLFMVYLIIGIPRKAPVFTIDRTEITMAHTTVGEMLSDGFDIYINQQVAPGRNYEELLSCENFKKYPADRSVLVAKGFRRDDTAVPYAPYLLVKDDAVLGSIGLYGDKSKDMILEDCTIIHFRLDEDCIAAARAHAVRYCLNDMELMVPLKLETLKKTFGEKLWSVPPRNPIDITQLHYGIQWSTGSNHLFWNEYFAYIDFDESDEMTGFTLSTEIARDRKKDE